MDLKEQIRTARERFAKVKLERSSFERRLETDQSDVAELQIAKAKQEQDYLKRIADLECAWKLSEEEATRKIVEFEALRKKIEDDCKAAGERSSRTIAELEAAR